MPFMQRITWSGIAMHLGVVPGHPASHGCIRLPAEFAAKLWGLTKIGERVVISPQDVTPVEFEHPLLPAAEDADSGGSQQSRAAVDSPQAPLSPPPSRRQSIRVNTPSNSRSRPRPQQLRRPRAVKEASAVVGVKRQEAARSATELRAAEAAHASAQSKGDAAARAYEAASAIAAIRQQESRLGGGAQCGRGQCLGPSEG